MQSLGDIEDVKKKIHAKAREKHRIGNFVWASSSGGVGGSRKKFNGKERRAKGRVRLHRVRGSAEKRKSGMSGKRHRPKPIPWEKNSWRS